MGKRQTLNFGLWVHSIDTIASPEKEKERRRKTPLSKPYTQIEHNTSAPHQNPKMHAIRSLLQSRHLTPPRSLLPASLRLLSSTSGAGGGDSSNDEWDLSSSSSSSQPPPQPPSSTGPSSSGVDWGDAPSWSSGSTKDHFDGAYSDALATVRAMDDEEEILRAVERDNVADLKYVDSLEDRFAQTCALLKQVREPGSRGSYLKDSEKQEMYRLHKENPEVYTVERLAKDYRIMRQRVHAILWLKEMEEEEEKKLGKPLDDSVEILLDNFPEFFNSHDREFHVASLPYKPDFKVMPEGWDGTARDPDEVLYEISMKEDQMLYEEFVQRLEFNKKKVAGEVKCHKYSRRRPDEGWNFTVEKLGQRDKRGHGGGWKFVSLPDGSSRSLNDMEKMYLKREKPKMRRRIIAPFK
ncbi:Ribosomal protein L20 [Rhynchospora pubera]|uniref:Ribosomal protein L20 n=1 Tax=Rhynchospora pubera TaxID=906938 RepID=A0AAV8C5T2_9POAL|nr:Ribosomal protein L20 [Rhynchospora pubera]